MPKLSTLSDGTPICPGLATIHTAAGTFALDRVVNGMLHFEVKAPIDRWGSLQYIALGDNGVAGYWYPPVGCPFIPYSDDRTTRWVVDKGYDLYVLALSCSSARVELRIADDQPAKRIDRTFSGPWLKEGVTLIPPIRFASDSSLDICARASKSREGKQHSKPVAIDLSYLLVQLKE